MLKLQGLMKFRWLEKNSFLAATIALLTVLSVLLAGCGFQLRGMEGNGIPPALARTYIAPVMAADPSFLRLLRQRLSAQGVALVDQADSASSRLQILSTQNRQRLLASAGRDTSRLYQLSFDVIYQLNDDQGKVLVTRDQIHVKRDILYAESALLGRAEGEQLVRHELHREAVTAMLRRLTVRLQQAAG